MEDRWSESEWLEAMRVADGVARRSFGKYAEAEDIAGDALLKMVVAVERGEVVARRNGWAARITRNTGLDRLSAKRPEVPIAEEHLAKNADLPASLLNQQRAHEVLDAISQIEHEGHRSAVILADLRGLDHYEIAALLGVRYDTARQWASRGRQAVRKRLATTTLWESEEGRVDPGPPPLATSAGVRAAARATARRRSRRCGVVRAIGSGHV